MPTVESKSRILHIFGDLEILARRIFKQAQPLPQNQHFNRDIYCGLRGPFIGTRRSECVNFMFGGTDHCNRKNLCLT